MSDPMTADTPVEAARPVLGERAPVLLLPSLKTLCPGRLALPPGGSSSCLSGVVMA